MQYLKTSTLIFSLLLFVSCADPADTNQQSDMDHQAESEMSTSNSEMDESAPEFTELVSVLNPTAGNDVTGVVRFSETDDGVRIVAEVNGLEPNSTHGFHIHQYGDCSAEDGTSAGGHFNPQDTPHAGPESDERHVGDLGNITVNEDGVAELEYVDPMLSFSGQNNILGRGVIVHAGEDDLESQPTGDAGSRLSCGVIGVAEQ